MNKLGSESQPSKTPVFNSHMTYNYSMFHLFGLHWTSGPGEEDIEKKMWISI